MSVAANIAARKSAETVFDLITGELRTLIDAHGHEAVAPFFSTLRSAFGDNLRVAAPASDSGAPARPQPQASDAESALEAIDEALELAERVPERGQEFAESVSGRLRSIAATIDDQGEVTAGQLAAIENMRAGLERWVR